VVIVLSGEIFISKTSNSNIYGIETTSLRLFQKLFFVFACA
jgi:hypothetical protein